MTRISVFAIGRVFLEMGATAFGGLGPALAVLERELIEKRRALHADDLAAATAAARLLPGSALTQVVSFLGYRLGGWSGSVIATTAFLAPALVAMILLAFFYDTLPVPPAFGPAVAGLKASVVGLLLATMCRLGRTIIRGPFTLGLAVLSFTLTAALAAPVAAVVIGAGLSGILVYRTRKRNTT
jgi:chromate transporter